MKGSVFQRGSTYTYVLDIGRDNNGKRHQKTKGGFKTKKEAQKALNEHIYEVEKNIYINVDKRTLAEYLDDWLKNHVLKNLAINTANGYKVNIEKHIKPYIGNIPLGKLQPSHIQKLYNDKINEGLSPTSVIYIHRVLHKALQQAVKLQLLSRNVTDFVELPKKKPYDIKVLNEEQIKAVLEAAKGTYLYMAILLAVSLGLRRGEVLGLKWADVDYDYSVINISRTQVTQKGSITYAPTKSVKSKRGVLISESVISLLKSLKAEQDKNKQLLGEAYNDNDLIICQNDGSPVTACALNKAFYRLFDKNNFDLIRFHDLRHTNATLMLKNKIPAKIVSERLGHSNIGITLDLYSHVTNEMQKEAANLLDKSIF